VLNEKPHDENVWDRRGVALLILNLGINGGERSFSFFYHFTAVTGHRRVGRLAGWLAAQLEEREVSPTAMNQTMIYWLPCPQCSHCTD
jgi:hypothetical protein